MKTYYNLYEYRETTEDDFFVDYSSIGFCVDVCVRYRAGKKSCFVTPRRRKSFTVCEEMFKRDMVDKMKGHCYLFTERVVR